jgi:hypothetical protein
MDFYGGQVFCDMVDDSGVQNPNLLQIKFSGKLFETLTSTTCKTQKLFETSTVSKT